MKSASKKNRFRNCSGFTGLLPMLPRKMKAFFQGEHEECRVISQMATPAKMKGIKDAKEKDEWDQIKEGYAHLKRAEVKNFLTALESLDGALDMIIEESKANRKSPTRKPKSADKVVAKMKYKVKQMITAIISTNNVKTAL